jgi:hypothetical protein
MDRLYHTYPELLDPAGLNAARVEAALRRSTTQAGRELLRFRKLTGIKAEC